jgi:hypothetical protein
MRVRATTVAITLVLAITAPIQSAAADPPPRADQAGTPELSVTNRLADRRAVVMGDRLYSVGTEDGLYPAPGFHTRGEMGGFWSPPMKLLDGIWFGLDGAWLGDQVAAQRFTAGFGHTRVDYAATNGVRVERTDVSPDGARAGLVGLTFRADSSRTVRLDVDAHSELMSAYPWGGTTPNQLAYNLQDTGAFKDGALVFRDQGKPNVPNADAHDFTALVAADRTPVDHQLGAGHRGPQEPPVVCPADGDQPDKCDDTAFGKGTGGRLSYDVAVPANRDVTVWIAVAGSDQGSAAAQGELKGALRDPAGALARKIADRRALAGNTVVDLPGDRLLQQSVEWSKQNLADSVLESHDLRLRSTNAGAAFPAPQGTLDKARWIAAGIPDYHWLFGTDGEYTAFASVAAGQFDPIKAHLRALRDASDIINDRSGKVIHEMASDGSVFFGANDDAGNTDETAKFPSVVALVWRWTGDRHFLNEMYDFSARNMRHVVNDLDADGDGWPEGLGNVERQGMGVEKLDNVVYTIRGLRDLADLARAKGDKATESWATGHASALESRFDQEWWFGGDTDQFADSIDDPSNPANDNTKIFQRHWIGVTPMDAELVRPGQVTHPLATDEHAHAALARREEACYTGESGLFHTGTGPTSAEGGNKGAACDTSVSSVQSERSVFSLGNGVMAAAEGNFGRLGQQRTYTTRNARMQLDPTIWEMPGAMPEIAPSPDFKANIDQRPTERSSVLQAWGTYGTLWPVVHHQLGIAPDLGNGGLSIVPQLPPGQNRVAGRNVRLGGGAVDVTAEAGQGTLRTVVSSSGTGADLLIGQVLPAGAKVASVTLNGKPVATTVRQTARGSEVVTDAGSHSGTYTLVVTLR